VNDARNIADPCIDLRVDPFMADALTALVSRAAARVLDIRSSTLAVRHKADASPVTLADEASEEIIIAGLNDLLPGLAVISEEAAARRAPHAQAACFALVDPLDGTREFVAGSDEFVINLAIVSNGRPLFGVVAAPALGLVWRGGVTHAAERLALPPGLPPEQARDRTAIRTRALGDAPPRILVSRSHLDPDTAAWIGRYPRAETAPCGSALKFCRIAQGAADIYPRLAPTMDWDVGAGDAVLTAAGGAVLTAEGRPLTYGAVDRDLRIPAFIAWGRPPES
jgi:3'(2'), 5'-bisphosphate nucleotidase